MASMNMHDYIVTPAAVFDLNCRRKYSDPKAGTPCRIKVGPRRWLEEDVHPEELSVTIWLERDGHITYLPNEPVQTSVDKNGVLTVDMASFAQEYFGKDNVSFCDSEHWQWYKYRPSSDTFLTTDYGAAVAHTFWLDGCSVFSYVYLMPGTLNLCGQDIRQISWQTHLSAQGADGESMRPLIEAALSGPHTISRKDLIKRLKALESLQCLTFGYLRIRTDSGEFHMGDHLNVQLNGVDLITDAYAPNRNNRDTENVDILLQMLEASSADKIRAAVDANVGQGRLVRERR